MNKTSGKNLRTLGDLRPGDHVCCLYQSGGEHWKFLRSFVRQGLQRGERSLYITNAQSKEHVLRALKKDRRNAERYLEEKQLEILTVDETFLQDNYFDPDKMISFLHSETDSALAEGYAGLRVTAEMEWVMRRYPGTQRLIEFESKLDSFLTSSKCLMMCQYDRTQFSSTPLLYVMATHPVAVVETEIYDNFYYMLPPDFLTRRGIPVATLHAWLENLTKRSKGM